MPSGRRVPDGEPAHGSARLGAPAAAWQDVSVRYPYAERSAAGSFSLELQPGERLLLLGPSGSGKSTLLGTLTGLIPQTIPAEVTGSVSLFGERAESRPPAGWAATVAQFFQDADQTLCGMRVADEIAFALENRALPEGVIRERVEAAMRQVGLPAAWAGRRSMSLSGGEKQLVALAATLAQDAPILVADEPTAHLAPRAAGRLHAILTERDPGRSVLVVDHRLDGLVGAVDRAAVLGPDGTVLAAGPPAPLFRSHAPAFAAAGIWVPLASRLDAALAGRGLAPAVPPLALDELVRHLDGLPLQARAAAREVVKMFAAEHAAPPRASGAVVASLDRATCAPFLGPIVLTDVSLEIREGEILGILGANGVGKSTLGVTLAGLLPLRAGRRFGAAGGVAFQNPENQFTAGSVREEIVASLPAGDDRLWRAEVILAKWSLADLATRHPFALSQGQKRRLALASLTASRRWPLLVLDEPTAGLDAAGAANLEHEARALAVRGHALAVITHDMDLALRVCSRGLVLGSGGILAEGAVAQLLQDPQLLEAADLAPPAIAPLLRWLEGPPC